MADAYFIVTLSSAEAGSGPNYDVLYSTDCVSYSPATPATVTLEYVGAQSYITLPDNTQCVKLTNINSNCTNSETSSVTITTTTTSTTTTAAPTTTTTTTIAPTTTTTTTPVDCRINTTINVTDTGVLPELQLQQLRQISQHSIGTLLKVVELMVKWYYI